MVGGALWEHGEPRYQGDDRFQGAGDRLLVDDASQFRFFSSPFRLLRVGHEETMQRVYDQFFPQVLMILGRPEGISYFDGTCVFPVTLMKLRLFRDSV